MSAPSSGIELLEHLLATERQMGLVGARFLHAAGRSYSQRMDHREVETRYGIGPLGECFRNAFELALAHPELTYCEGRGAGVWPVEHAWCVNQDGLVVDTTWQAGPASYVGVCFSNDFLVRWVRETQRLGVMAEMFPKQLLMWKPEDYLAGPTLEELKAVRLLQAELSPKSAARRPA